MNLKTPNSYFKHILDWLKLHKQKITTEMFHLKLEIVNANVS